MSGPRDHQPLQGSLPDTATATASAIVETRLHRARITMLHPSRIVIVGSGQRLQIDHEGVSRHALSHARLVVSPPSEAATDAELQRTLARWAGRATPLRVDEVVHIGEGATRTLRLIDPQHVHADVWLPATNVVP